MQVCCISPNHGLIDPLGTVSKYKLYPYYLFGSNLGSAFGLFRGPSLQRSFSYVDPRNQVRTVEYVADKEGFHPVLSKVAPSVTDTPAVAAAKALHLARWERIAADHARIAAERAALEKNEQHAL
ncbi:hypothetical protein J437_LFUL001277 [Ladona fulva]|uniref:Uncharacterized protein n=1 Tax=Ladona fulva TaxID=123851 RepID=A0A8K0NRN4_LADFU|nr:hypothetical protein J437_LFUL001277 [Ladona fulva]